MNPQDILETLERLMARAGAERHLGVEMLRAEREFLGEEQSQSEVASDGRRIRFVEWFLLERDSDVLGGIPAELLPLTGNDRDTVGESLCGVFLVAVAGPDAIQATDVQDGALVDLVPMPEVLLQPGDMLVGRLYPNAFDSHVLSPVIALHRHGTQVAQAFEQDLRRVGLDRRLTQLEIEHLMFRVEPDVAEEDHVPLERVEADLEQMLERGGLGERLPVSRVSQMLADAPSPGPVVNRMLEEVAFYSDIDIQAMQRLMLRLHAAQLRAPHVPRKPAAPAGPPPKKTREQTPTQPRKDSTHLGQDVARRIEEGLARHKSIEELFQDVGKMIGEDLSESDELGRVSAGGTSLDDEGDLPALVREYVWETGRNDQKDVLWQFVQNQTELPVPQMALEAVHASDLVRFLLQKYLSAAPGERALQVRASFAVIEDFYAWAIDTQQYKIQPALDQARALMVDPIERVDTASTRLSVPGATDAKPELLRVLRTLDDRLEVSRVADDSVLEVVAESVGETLVEGDLLLGPLSRPNAKPEDAPATFVGMVVAMPAAAEAFLG